MIQTKALVMEHVRSLFSVIYDMNVLKFYKYSTKKWECFERDVVMLLEAAITSYRYTNIPVSKESK